MPRSCFFFVEQNSPISVLLSIVTLLAITVDNFIFINWPLKYDLIVTWRRIYFALLMIWVFDNILIAFTIFFTTTEPCGIKMFLSVSVFVWFTYVSHSGAHIRVCVEGVCGTPPTNNGESV